MKARPRKALDLVRPSGWSCMIEFWWLSKRWDRDQTQMHREKHRQSVTMKSVGASLEPGPCLGPQTVS